MEGYNPYCTISLPYLNTRKDCLAVPFIHCMFEIQLYAHSGILIHFFTGLKNVKLSPFSSLFVRIKCLKKILYSFFIQEP